MDSAIERAPFPDNSDEFDADVRISFSKSSNSYILEDEKRDEWEWMAKIKRWVPVVRKPQNPVPTSLGRLWPAYPLPFMAGSLLT